MYPCFMCSVDLMELLLRKYIFLLKECDFVTYTCIGKHSLYVTPRISAKLIYLPFTSE